MAWGEFGVSACRVIAYVPCGGFTPLPNSTKSGSSVIQERAGQLHIHMYRT